MHRLCVALGSARAEVVSDVPEVLEIVRAALPAAVEPADVDARIAVLQAEGRRRSSEDGDGQAFRFEGDITYRYDAGRQRYSVTVGELAWGEIDLAGSAATWWLAAPMLPRSMLHALVLDPLSLMLPCRGVLICHGAAVVAADGATLLLGRSGSGKSTLTYLLSSAEPAGELRPLTDDTMVLDFTGEVALAYPIQSGFGVPEVLMASGRTTAVAGRSAAKVYVAALPGMAEGAHPVRRIVFLEKGRAADGETVLEPVAAEGAVRLLLESQSSIPSPGLVERLLGFERLSRQAAAVRARYGGCCDVAALRNSIQEAYCCVGEGGKVWRRLG